MPFYIWANQPNSIANPITDIFTPCIKTEYNLYYTNARVRGTEAFYEGGNSMGCVGPGGCMFPIGGTIPPFSGASVWALLNCYMDYTKQHDWVFSKTAGTWNTFSVTVQNCWDNSVLPSTVSTPFVWTNTINNFTVSIPANTNIGIANFSIAPSGTSALTDLHNGYCAINPTLLTAGVTYTVTYTFSSSVCSNMQGAFTFTKGNPGPLVNVNSPSICPGNSATLTCTGANSFTWSPGGQSTQSIVVTPTVNTTYTVTGTATGCIGSASAVSAITIGQCLVWPGDADNDLNAANSDLLPIGIYFGQTGNIRSSASNTWVGQNCTDWIQIQTNNGNNLKFADCDGDGSIAFADTLALNLNFGLNHPAKLSSAHAVGSVNPDVYLVFNQSSYLPTDTVKADVYIGSASNAQSNFYGSAFEINYDASIVIPGSEKFWFVNSWVGTINQSKIKFSNINSGLGKVYASLVKITHNDTGGYGKVGTLQFVLNNPSTPRQLYLSASNSIKTNSNGNYTVLTSGTDSASVVSGTTFVNYNGIKDFVKIYPNPGSGSFFVEIKSELKDVYSIQIQNSLGQVIYGDKIMHSGNTTQKTISLEGFGKGIYTAIIQSGNNRYAHKIVIE